MFPKMARKSIFPVPNDAHYRFGAKRRSRSVCCSALGVLPGVKINYARSL
jgi:hypothetical protein